MVIVWTSWLVISVRMYFREHGKFWIVMMLLSALNIVFDVGEFNNWRLMNRANERQRDE